MGIIMIIVGGILIYNGYRTQTKYAMQMEKQYASQNNWKVEIMFFIDREKAFDRG